MKRAIPQEYLDRAKSLSREEAEEIFSRMRQKMMRRIEDKGSSSLEAVAMQLQKENEDLIAWRERWAEVISSHYDELVAFFRRNPTRIVDSFKASFCPAGLCIRIQELSSDTKLPIACVHKPGLHDYP
ncbi:MAG: hypothetical protein IV084_06815 [Rugosibacter sp.]|nr:hypothetical protein [Rugosibacter sp.]